MLPSNKDMQSETLLKNYADLLKVYEIHERRRELWRNAARRHYTKVASQKILQGIRAGIIPRHTTVDKRFQDSDRDMLTSEWKDYVAGLKQMSKKARAFHRYLIGEEWRPEVYQKCV